MDPRLREDDGWLVFSTIVPLTAQKTCQTWSKEKHLFLRVCVPQKEEAIQGQFPGPDFLRPGTVRDGFIL